VRVFKAVKVILAVSTEPTGAVVQRQIFEKAWVLSDWGYALLCELLVIVDFVHLLACNFYDFWFVGWADDLSLIWGSFFGVVLGYVNIPTAQATG
jgi:hypothetical protein